MIHITINNEEFHGLVCEFDVEPLLRDLFAGLAMNADVNRREGNFSDNHECEIAEESYRIADAMLAQRREPKS